MLTFFMNDVVQSKHRSSAPVNGAGVPVLPPKPMDLFSPKNGNPLDKSNPTFSPSQTTSPHSSWLPMLTNLQALEAGTVTIIDEEFKGIQEFGLPLIGKVQGIYITSSQNSSGSSSSHMVAMKSTFSDGKSEDSLRFFGVHELNLAESHIAVVGGTGKYDGANGFAIIKAIDSNDAGGGDESLNKVLRVTVYLK
ncbi:dirigent protein 25-like [Typha latifolia]|uniref:dirigent protein 25-like n=1 Tax=Typha latifolia TaxID=4733 RepID=UPI003C2B7DCB